MGKRYSVLWFPALYGEPYETDWWVLSRLVAWWRLLAGRREVRIIDARTGEHTVF